MAIEIRKLKSGKSRYIVRVTDGTGKHFSCKSFPNRRDALSYEAKLKEQRFKGETVEASPKSSLPCLFRWWLELQKAENL